MLISREIRAEWYYQLYAKQRVIALRVQGFKAPTIANKLREEGTYVTHVGIHKFLCMYEATHTIQ